VRLKPDGTRWRKGGEVKGKLANAVGSQYSSYYLGTCCIQHYYRWCAHLDCQYSTELTPPADLNGLVRFAERRNLFSARVPSHFKRTLPGCAFVWVRRGVKTVINRETPAVVCNSTEVNATLGKLLGTTPANFRTIYGAPKVHYHKNQQRVRILV
jgi:hypothetical protein